MKKALFKDTFREIKGSLSKFFSIFAIVALGVAFFAGIKVTCADMKITADKYFDEHRLMDMEIVSTVGFNDEDVESIKNVSGAQGVFPTYSIDALVEGKDGDMVIKVLSLPMDKIEESSESYINRTKLVEGRYPEKSEECVAEKGKIFNSELSIGSKIKLSSGTKEDIGKSLKRKEYTIVGMVETPSYITDERGTTNIGNGKIDNFIMIPEDNFKIPVFTEVFLTFKDAREAFCYDDKYDEILEPKRKKIDTLGKDRSKKRYDEIVNEANKKLDENKKKLRYAEEKANKEFTVAAQEIADGEKEILKREKELNFRERNFKQMIQEAEIKIVNGEKELEEREKEYNKNIKSFIEAKKQAEIEILKREKQIEEFEQEVEENKVKLNEIKEILKNNDGDLSDEERVSLIETYTKGQEKLKIGEKKSVEAKLVIEDKKKELSNTENKFIAGKKALDASKKQIAIERLRLENSKKKASDEFAMGYRKLEDSRQALVKGKLDYENAKKEAEENIEKAREKIAVGEKEVKSIDIPEWYVIKRNQTLDFIDYGMAADRIDAIAKVFPVFFFLIAALVSFTTMTRMVDEQRVYIGTLKALGYSKIAIASKYIIYAGLASVSGGILGALLGFKIFPTIIFNAYRIMYIMPPVVTEFNMFYAIVSIAFGVISTTFAAWFSCYKELTETPALLMRPKIQKPGKRILLEKVKLIWSKLNFIQKVTIRNLIRYKKRLFMTILGVGGCTALMVAGFGLKDSIMATPTKQFDEIYQYDMSMDFKDRGYTSIKKLVEKNQGISDYMLTKKEHIELGTKTKKENAFLIIPEDSKRMEEFIILRNRVSEENIPLTEDGVVLTEKMAQLLNVEVGDEIYIKDEGNKKINVKITGITENYVSHYVYMAPKLFQKFYGEKPKFQQLIAKTIDTSKDFENKLSTEFLKDPKVASVDFITGISSSYKDMIGSLNYVVLVLIISAGALAFVVLYNLTNVNISERLREIATIKVLGFYDDEVSAYVYNENTILTIIGIIIGLVMGVFLHKYIILTGEIDYIMFGRDIKPISFIYSTILTIMFAVSVNFVMYFRLQKIKMVESLKSVE